MNDPSIGNSACIRIKPHQGSPQYANREPGMDRLENTHEDPVLQSRPMICTEGPVVFYKSLIAAPDDIRWSRKRATELQQGKH